MLVLEPCRKGKLSLSLIVLDSKSSLSSLFRIQGNITLSEPFPHLLYTKQLKSACKGLRNACQ